MSCVHGEEVKETLQVDCQDSGNKSGVYLICFGQNPKTGKQGIHHAKHYVGWSSDIALREERHLSGFGAKLLKAAILLGVPWRIVAVWPGKDRNYERSIKKSKNTPIICPRCNPGYRGKFSNGMLIEKGYRGTFSNGMLIEKAEEA